MELSEYGERMMRKYSAMLDEPKCKACLIEKNDEQVKQMPEHTCEKGKQQITVASKLATIDLMKICPLPNECVHPNCRCGEESQEELWEDFMNVWDELRESEKRMIPELMKRFTITRKEQQD